MVQKTGPKWDKSAKIRSPELEVLLHETPDSGHPDSTLIGFLDPKHNFWKTPVLGEMAVLEKTGPKVTFGVNPGPLDVGFWTCCMSLLVSLNVLIILVIVAICIDYVE